MAKHKAREAAKTLAGLQKEAAAIVSKLTPVLASISALEDGAEFRLVASPVVQPLLDTKARMECAMAAAADVMVSTDPDDVPECATLKEVMDWIAMAKKTIALITNMLAMIARAGRG
jgi:hypothetical protein